MKTQEQLEKLQALLKANRLAIDQSIKAMERLSRGMAESVKAMTTINHELDRTLHAIKTPDLKEYPQTLVIEATNHEKHGFGFNCPLCGNLQWTSAKKVLAHINKHHREQLHPETRFIVVRRQARSRFRPTVLREDIYLSLYRGPDTFGLGANLDVCGVTLAYPRDENQ